MSPDDSSNHRRAIEALRAGVPNRDAVSALGCNQPEIVEKYNQQLEAVHRDGSTPGVLVAGGFGTGKSHLLEYLQQIALERNFVCSKVVVSKETPLYDPLKLLHAAVYSATVPNRHGAALTEIAERLQPDSAEFAALEQHVSPSESGLCPQFGASLFLFRKAGYKSELGNSIVSFWSGAPVNLSDLRRELRAHGEAATYPLATVKKPELALQRFSFLPQLAKAAGYMGWVLLVDEVELIGRYSPLQRAKAYGELARWLGKARGISHPNLVVVCAITATFESLVLDAKNDMDLLPDRIAIRGGPDAVQMVKAGTRAVKREKLTLRPPDREQVMETYKHVRQIYEHAHVWPVPDGQPNERLGSTAMREHVRSWINEWDLERLYPGYRPVTIVAEGEVDVRYSEDKDLEKPSESDSVETNGLTPL